MPKDSIARVAQTRDNIAVLVEVVIERAGIDFDIRMVLLEIRNAFGRGNEDHELDVLAAALFHLVDCSGSGAAGGKHRVDNEDIALGDVLGHFAEVDVGDEGFFITEHADVTDTGGRNHAQNAVDQTETARRMGTTANFLPASVGASISQIGVSMCLVVMGRSRVAS